MSAAPPTQVQIHPSRPNLGEYSLDFVGSTASPGKVVFGFNGASATLPTTSFAYPNIGTLHQAVLDFGRFGVTAGAKAWYQASADNGATFSLNFTVTPIVAVPRVAIWGDFGLSNDIIMAQLAADSSVGLFDAAHHVGDFA